MNIDLPERRILVTGCAPQAPGGPLPASLVLLLATGAGLGAASLYYSQPMLGVLGADLHAPGHVVGWVPFVPDGYDIESYGSGSDQAMTAGHTSTGSGAS